MRSPKTTAGITVGELIERLKVFHPDAELFFGGLRFNRLKLRGERLLQLEFVEQVYRTERGEIVAEDVD